MDAYKTVARIEQKGELRLSDLPFHTGDEVEVILLRRELTYILGIASQGETEPAKKAFGREAAPSFCIFPRFGQTTVGIIGVRLVIHRRAVEGPPHRIGGVPQSLEDAGGGGQIHFGQVIHQMVKSFSWAHSLP
jgi:hypothetical protein